MRKDHHTGWMVPCSLQPVYAEKYVKWKLEGEVCVDVRLLVSFSTDGLCRDVDAGVLLMYTSLPAGEEFSSVFTCFLLLAYTFYSLFFSCFFFVIVAILYITRSHYSQFS